MLEFIWAYWWLLLLESLAVAGIMGLIALNANRLVGDTPRGVMALKASMTVTALATFIAYVSVMVGVFKLIEYYTGSAASAQAVVWGATILSALLILFQWLMGPALVNLFYRTRDPQTPGELQLARELERLAERSGIRPPKLKIAELNMPNAFAYGSPLMGNYVAVTRGLLRVMPREEVRAVLGHEVGHLKHRDVSWIIALSLIPLAVYFIGRSLVWTGFLGGGGDRERGNPLVLLAAGVALIGLSVAFRFLIAHFNRLREYYADYHGALVSGSPRYMQRALARLDLAYKSNPYLLEEARSNESMAMLFIVAPFIELSGGFFMDIDEYGERLKRVEPSPLEELLATHPPIPKRIRFLDTIAVEPRIEA